MENMFETLYLDLVNYCMEYNKEINEIESLFGENRFVHIKGGGSIKHHLIKHRIPVEYHVNITSDLDLFMVCSEEFIVENVNKFIDGLKKTFYQYTITHKNENGLIKILFNNNDIIDITIFNDEYVEIDPETSMFYYACEKIGKSESEYFAELNKLNANENYLALERKTFTNVEFEYYATEKGILIYNEYLENIPKWQMNYEKWNRMYLDLTLPLEKRQQAEKFAKIYEYQLSESYVEKLKRKYRRYQNKLRLLKMLLETK